MASYHDWDSLVDGAQQKIKTVLNEDVRPEVEDVLKKRIQTDIYDGYTPTGYKRRGALGSSEYIRGEILDDDTLAVTSTAPPSPPVFSSVHRPPHEPKESMLLQWIEGGHVPNYFDDKSYPWMKPRTALENAQAEINKSSNIIAKIRDGIKRRF